MAPENKAFSFINKIVRSLRNEKLKVHLLQALPFWIGSLITGLIAVAYAKLFAGAEGVVAYVVHTHKLWLLLLTPSLFLLGYFLVRNYAPYAVGSGIPQVMAAIDLANPKHDSKVKKLLSIRVMITKIASSLLMAMGGAAIGREGPTIQIASSVFRKINQWIPDSWPRISRRNMIMTGAAAGLAAAFNTPLGGVVFAVEELTRTHIRYFRTEIFSAVIIAGLTAQFIMGPYLYLGYPDVSNIGLQVLIWVVPVAIVTGLMGSAMCKLIVRILQWKGTLTSKQTWLYVVFCAMVMTVIALTVSTQVLGSGKEIMNTVLFSANKKVEWYTPIIRFIGPVVCFTSGGAGGVFAPALSGGASVGAMMAGWFSLSPQATDLLILSGMVGFLTGVTRTPFTSAILVLEMTDRHNVILHLMLAGMVASLVSTLIDKHSFYDHMKLRHLKRLAEEEKAETAATGSLA